MILMSKCQFWNLDEEAIQLFESYSINIGMSMTKFIKVILPQYCTFQHSHCLSYKIPQLYVMWIKLCQTHLINVKPPGYKWDLISPIFKPNHFITTVGSIKVWHNLVSCHMADCMYWQRNRSTGKTSKSKLYAGSKPGLTHINFSERFRLWRLTRYETKGWYMLSY
jgi:hypothetical protein